MYELSDKREQEQNWEKQGKLDLEQIRDMFKLEIQYNEYNICEIYEIHINNQLYSTYKIAKEISNISPSPLINISKHDLQSQYCGHDTKYCSILLKFTRLYQNYDYGTTTFHFSTFSFNQKTQQIDYNSFDSSRKDYGRHYQWNIAVQPIQKTNSENSYEIMHIPLQILNHYDQPANLLWCLEQWDENFKQNFKLIFSKTELSNQQIIQYKDNESAFDSCTNSLQYGDLQCSSSKCIVESHVYVQYIGQPTTSQDLSKSYYFCNNYAISILKTHHDEI